MLTAVIGLKCRMQASVLYRTRWFLVLAPSILMAPLDTAASMLSGWQSPLLGTPLIVVMM